jgi:hypothetical protein
MVSIMRFPLKTLSLAVLLCAVAIPAKADVFMWRDADTRMTVTYADTWRSIHNQQPDDVLTVAAPGDGEYATCRLRVRDDGRFKIYPTRYSDEIQRLNYSRDFWDAYVGEFAGASINGVWDDAGLGDGFASFADVSFISNAGPKVQKRGIMFATVYGNNTYIAECSSETASYEHWYKNFLSFVKSVDFRDAYHIHPNGWYRDFTTDEVIRIRGAKDVDLYTN